MQTKAVLRDVCSLYGRCPKHFSRRWYLLWVVFALVDSARDAFLAVKQNSFQVRPEATMTRQCFHVIHDCKYLEILPFCCCLNQHPAKSWFSSSPSDLQWEVTVRVAWNQSAKNETWATPSIHPNSKPLVTCRFILLVAHPCASHRIWWFGMVTT